LSHLLRRQHLAGRSHWLLLLMAMVMAVEGLVKELQQQQQTKQQRVAQRMPWTGLKQCWLPTCQVC
jgi:hypothetical protein